MSKTINWGILGPGRIAEKFADAFKSTPDAKLYAVASRERGRAKEFASKFKVPKVHDNYEALVADPDVDIIYIATPHNFHHEQAMLCLKGKKAVLCEKPLTLTHKSAQEMIGAAKVNDVFLMEAMWSRFFPAVVEALELVRRGVIGEVRFLRADFGFSAPYDPLSRVYNMQLAGGAQLDVGVYPMFLAMLFLGKPEKIQGISRLAPTGADETTIAQFSFKGGHTAQIMSSVVVDSPKQAEIMGMTGTITLHSPWHKSQGITVRMNDGKTRQIDRPYSGIGFEFQLQHVTDCMQKGLRESPLMTHELSLQMAEVADEILRQGGVNYPTNNFS